MNNEVHHYPLTSNDKNQRVVIQSAHGDSEDRPYSYAREGIENQEPNLSDAGSRPGLSTYRNKLVRNLNAPQVASTQSLHSLA
jgi:hypothetical protein